MARKKKLPEPPSKAYLISFGDTMTALLAFFIVLNSLAQEQTGAKLHAGTGSFIRAFQGKGGAGSPGNKTVSQAFQMPKASAVYVIPDEGEASTDIPTGTDDTEESERIINRQEEEFQRFIQEVSRRHDMEKLPDLTGDVNFDVFGVMPLEPPFMSEELKQIALDSAPMFRRPGHTIRLTVWARMPSQKAWMRAVRQAEALRQEIRELLGPAADRYAIEATGQPWISETAKRPAVSLVISREGPGRER